MNSPPILDIYFLLDWEVHWGYDLDFDPWPCGTSNLVDGLFPLVGVPCLLARIHECLKCPEKNQWLAVLLYQIEC